MVSDDSFRVKDVLAAAAIAPGNQARFYRAGLIDDEGKLVEDWQVALSRLCPLTKAEVRSRPGDFLAQANDVVYRGTTSGTTSTSFTYFAGDLWNQKRLEARQRSLAWWNLDEQTPVLNLASRLGPVRTQDSSLVGQIDSAFIDTLLQIVRVGPVILRGYPSRLCKVVVALHRHQVFINTESVVAVIATGECLFAFQSALLSKTFDAPVVNEYGAQESGISGLSCPEAGRLHLDSDRCLYEIVDGQLLTTDLYNTTMPMVRYSGGDVLEICVEPCTCGRAGLTARVLGRENEAILLRDRQVWPGEIELPPVSKVLSYQIQLQANKRQVWVQPETGFDPSDLVPVRLWLEQTFGAGNTEVLIDSPFIDSSFDVDTRDLSANSSQDWVEQVSAQSWSIWLQQPLPLGRAEDIAILLKQMVMPCHIAAVDLERSLTLTNSLIKSEADPDNTLEFMKIRVLLWAVSSAASHGDAADIYHSLLKRFDQWAQRQKRAEIEGFSALGFDLLAPLLVLDTSTALRFWPAVIDQIWRFWPAGLKADTFTVHHYLAVLEQAGQVAQRQSHPWTGALRPLSAVLLGDFHQFAAVLTIDTVTAWAGMVHVCPELFCQTIDTTDFFAIWQAQRRALLVKDSAAVRRQLDLLFEAADSPEQIARCWLEKGYAALVFEATLDSTIWAEVLREHVGSLGHQKSGQYAANPLPWVPILKALAPKMIAANQPDIAYSYLLTAAPPNRLASIFDRQSQGVNGKQSVISSARIADERL